MAITGTTIADLVPNEKVLAGLVNMYLEANNSLVTSGLAVRGPEVDAVASGGPRKASIPFLNPLQTENAGVAVVNVSNDDITDQGDVGKLTADEFGVLRHELNNGWGYADLARMVTQFDAQGGINAGLGAYWSAIYQHVAMKSILGCIGVDAGLTFDGGDATQAFSYDMVVDATATAGVYADSFDILAPSPKTYAKMRKDQKGFTPGSETASRFDEWYGFKLIKTKAFGDTKTLVARSGALAFGEGVSPAMTPIEIERLANAGNGGGASILHSRRSVVIHPQGFGYKGATSIAPAALATSSNWELAIPDLELVGFRMLNHDEAE